MAVKKNNGDIISFLKQKDYIMVNNDLGGGSFGKAVVLKDPYIDELFVAKKYEPEYDAYQRQFYKNFIDEIKILYRLNHKNIVRIYSYYAYENEYTGYILMEFIDGMDIGKYLYSYQDAQSEFSDDPTPNSIFTQLIDAFCYIESHNIIHRDIRESNIMIDKLGNVKIIDFGIGKVSDSQQREDSLANQINRRGLETLPQEYYNGEYTSLTDMFYLAELLNRLMATAENPKEIHFSYQKILDKMMNKNPDNRYKNFAEIKSEINKHDFTSLEISEKDKKIYKNFTDLVYNSIYHYTSTPDFITDPEMFINNLRHAVQNNIFEDKIQNNKDVINSVVYCAYSYNPMLKIPCIVVKDFLKWFEESTTTSQNMILSNFISKLSAIRLTLDEDLPF